MAITLLQTHTVVNASASPASIVMGNTTLGSTIVFAAIYASSTPAPITSITDGGDAFTKVLTKQSAAGAMTLDVWYAFNVAARTTPTLSITYNTSLSDLSAIAREYSGLSTSDPLDQSTSAIGSSNAPSSGASLSTTVADELVVGASIDNLGAGQVYGLGSGFSNLASIVNASSENVAMEDKIVAATGAQTATFTLGTSTAWATAVITFKTPTVASGAVYTPVRPTGRNVGPMALRHNFHQPQIPYFVDGTLLANATITQVAGVVTAGGGTQSVASVQSVAIAQVAGVVTVTGGTQTVATVNIVSLAQVAGVVTASGGTQVIATVNKVAITQVAATVTAGGGTQVIATVNSVALSQVAGVVTAGGGNQVIATVNIVAISQVAATVTAGGGTQTLATVNKVSLAQLAGTVTAGGGTQVIATSNYVSLAQLAATVTAAGGTQAVSATGGGGGTTINMLALLGVG